MRMIEYRGVTQPVILVTESCVEKGRCRLVAMNCGVRGGGERGTNHTLLQSMTKDSSFEYL